LMFILGLTVSMLPPWVEKKIHLLKDWQTVSRGTIQSSKSWDDIYRIGWHPDATRKSNIPYAKP